MLFDIHTHVVPGVDDGSKSVDESIAILKELQKQGVDKVLATPHFYATQTSFDRYIDKVCRHTERLLEAADGMDLPEVLLGSEVYYFKNMSQTEELKRLCINGSRYILVELPYEPIDDYVIDDINAIVLEQKLTPILAHLERFYRYNSPEVLHSFFRHHDIECQVNAESLAKGLGKNKPLSLIQSGYCRFLGSDTHNLTSRPPYMDKAIAYIEKKLGTEMKNELFRRGDLFYQEITAE